MFIIQTSEMLLAKVRLLTKVPRAQMFLQTTIEVIRQNRSSFVKCMFSIAISGTLTIRIQIPVDLTNFSFYKARTKVSTAPTRPTW